MKKTIKICSNCAHSKRRFCFTPLMCFNKDLKIDIKDIEDGIKVESDFGCNQFKKRKY